MQNKIIMIIKRMKINYKIGIWNDKYKTTIAKK